MKKLHLKTHQKDEKKLSEKIVAPKRSYEKPCAMRIPLRPQEAVLVVCRSSSIVGPNGGNVCTDPADCFDITS